MYGVPFDTDIFFVTPYLRQKEEEDRKTHAIIQLGRFIKALRSLHPSNFNLSDGEVRSLNSLERTYAKENCSEKERNERDHFSPSSPLPPLSPHLPSTDITLQPTQPHPTLKRTKGNGPLKKKKHYYDDDEQYLDSYNVNNQNEISSSDDDYCVNENRDPNIDPEIQIIKVIDATDQSDFLPRIKPEMSDPDYDKNL